MPTCHRARRLVPRERRHRGVEPAVLTQLVRVEHARSSRAARAAGSSTRSSGATAPTRSSSGDCRCRRVPGASRCPRASSFSTITNGRPACAGSRRGCPSSPAPSGDAAFAPHPDTCVAPLDHAVTSASNCMSSTNIGTMIKQRPRGTPCISTTRSCDGASGMHPPFAVGGDGRRPHRCVQIRDLLGIEAGLQVEDVRHVRERHVRIHDGSPVAAPSEHSGAGTDTSRSRRWRRRRP